MDADPLKRPTADELFILNNDWVNEVFQTKDTEFYRQYKEAEEFNKSITSNSNVVSPSSYTTHPQAIYTSRLLDYKNLPEPQNSKEINIQFYKEFSGNYFFKYIFYSIYSFNINSL